MGGDGVVGSRLDKVESDQHHRMGRARLQRLNCQDFTLRVAACCRDCDWLRGYSGIMRYPDGGGLSAQARCKREAVRMQAAAWFSQGVRVREVARRLRVSDNSAYVWRRRWQANGESALVSRGPGGSRCRLSSGQISRLRAELELGPAAHGWDEDQRWTLARVTTLIGRLFHVRYTLRGASYLLHRIGFSPQVPVHRAAERDEKAITAWRTETWAKVRG